MERLAILYAMTPAALVDLYWSYMFDTNSSPFFFYRNSRYPITEKQYIEAMVEVEASHTELQILEDMAEGVNGLSRDPQILKYVFTHYACVFRAYSVPITEQ